MIPPLLARAAPAALLLLVAAPLAAADRATLAFVAGSGAQARILLVRDDGSGPRRLTALEGTESFPAWSPDGSRIAFISDDGGRDELYVARADGSKPRRLTSTGVLEDAPSWSPDGKRLAFTALHAGGADVFLIDADGAGLVNLTRSPGRDSGPAWSPDGAWIAFGSDRNAPELFGRPYGTQIHIVDRRGHRFRALTTGNACNLEHDGEGLNNSVLGWSADSGRLLFRAGACKYDCDACVLDLERRTLRSVSGDPVVRARHAAWSPDGERVVFVSRTKLYVTEPGGAGLRVVAGEAAEAVWLDDGRIAFVESRRGRRGGIVAIDVDGSGRRRLADPAPGPIHSLARRP